MNRFLFGVTALALVILAAGTAQAGGPGRHEGGRGERSHGSPSKNSYHFTHGTKFDHGYFYKGKDHKHWSHRCWSKRYGCYCYRCPSTRCWYYWYEPGTCYYPVSYATVCVPTVVTTTTVVSTELIALPAPPGGMPGPDAIAPKPQPGG